MDDDGRHRIVRFPGGGTYYMATASGWIRAGDRLWMYGTTAYSQESPFDAQAKADKALLDAQASASVQSQDN